MQSRQIDPGGKERTFALIFQTGDEVVSNLQSFARQHQLSGSHFTAIGAFSDATVAYFDWEKKDYKKIPVREQVEVLALTGDIATDEKTRQPKIHAHVVLGRSDASVIGGHLVEAHVRPTLEVVLTESPAHLRRRHDEQTGLALIRLE
jgi:predicted DNA-binding protein with PD1-like motif